LTDKKSPVDILGECEEGDFFIFSVSGAVALARDHLSGLSQSEFDYPNQLLFAIFFAELLFIFSSFLTSKSINI